MNTKTKYQLLRRSWSDLAFYANALANAKTKQERDATSLRVFCAIGEAKDAMPELRTLSEAVLSAKRQPLSNSEQERAVSMLFYRLVHAARPQPENELAYSDEARQILEKVRSFTP